jgi:hypothetical protein
MSNITSMTNNSEYISKDFIQDTDSTDWINYQGNIETDLIEVVGYKNVDGNFVTNDVLNVGDTLVGINASDNSADTITLKESDILLKQESTPDYTCLGSHVVPREDHKRIRYGIGRYHKLHTGLNKVFGYIISYYLNDDKELTAVRTKINGETAYLCDNDPSIVITTLPTSNYLIQIHPVTGMVYLISSDTYNDEKNRGYIMELGYDGLTPGISNMDLRIEKYAKNFYWSGTHGGPPTCCISSDGNAILINAARYPGEYYKIGYEGYWMSNVTSIATNDDRFDDTHAGWGGPYNAGSPIFIHTNPEHPDYLQVYIDDLDFDRETGSYTNGKLITGNIATLDFSDMSAVEGTNYIIYTGILGSGAWGAYRVMLDYKNSNANQHIWGGSLNYSASSQQYADTHYEYAYIKKPKYLCSASHVHISHCSPLCTPAGNQPGVVYEDMGLYIYGKYLTLVQHDRDNINGTTRFRWEVNLFDSGIWDKDMFGLLTPHNANNAPMIASLGKDVYMVAFASFATIIKINDYTTPIYYDIQDEDVLNILGDDLHNTEGMLPPDYLRTYSEWSLPTHPSIEIIKPCYTFYPESSVSGANSNQAFIYKDTLCIWHIGRYESTRFNESTDVPKIIHSNTLLQLYGRHYVPTIIKGYFDKYFYLDVHLYTSYAKGFIVGYVHKFVLDKIHTITHIANDTFNIKYVMRERTGRALKFKIKMLRAGIKVKKVFYKLCQNI